MCLTFLVCGGVTFHKAESSHLRVSFRQVYNTHFRGLMYF